MNYKNARPHIFVLVPFHGGFNHLKACIRSLDSQTVAFTGIVVNDGSDRVTSANVRELLSGCSQFVLLERESRGGPAAARSTGLEHICEASAHDDDIVVLVDGDDFLCRDRALEIIAGRYREHPRTKMSLGGMVVTGCEFFEKRPYRDWHLDLGLTRHLPSWRAHHPRTFRVGLYKECRGELKLRLPGGDWLPGATDMALLFPMLDRCSSAEVARIDLPLYAYRFEPLERAQDAEHRRRVLRQRFGEYYVRRSLIFGFLKTLRRPGRTCDALRGGWELLRDTYLADMGGDS